MPKAFDDCRRESGRIRTMTPNDSQYFRICFPPGGGPAVKGETKTKKDAEKPKKKKGS